RPGAGVHRHDRDRALGQHEPGARVPVVLRAGARQRAGHLRQGHRQPDRPDLVGRDDDGAPGPSGCGGCDREVDRAGAEGRPAHARHGRPIQYRRGRQGHRGRFVNNGGKMKRREFLIVGGAAAASIALPARAAYPEKPVHYIIAFAPGGESDIAARLQQEVWRKKWSNELVVESKAGAGGALAWSQLNGFPGDGYTIMGTNLPHIVLQPLEGNVQYATDDITNVNFFNYTPDGIVVRNESPFKTYQDFIAAAKAA